ncbi:hypothetical protein D8B46_00055 [Candidatus Gracilibacteria bacterium]|nr:MAG: hypothetical protein D8B46_00055 [Candidatus Gracilibacteria bacterium]
MEIFLGILTAILIFSVVVIVHEWGHFKSARIFGVKVEEFGLGIPPRAKKLFTDKKGTLFSLNWLPLGGFVKLTGEIPKTFLIYDENKNLLDNETIEKFISEKKDIFAKDGEKISESDKLEVLEILKENKADYNMGNKPAWQQSIIILAGIFMNFVLAFFVFFFLFWFGVKPIGINNKIETNLELKLIPTVEQAIEKGLLEKKEGIKLSPVSGGLAEKSGFNAGDTILEVNGKKIETPKQFTSELEKSKNSQIQIKRTCVNPCEQIVKVNLGADGKIGAYISENYIINQNFIEKYGPLESAKYAFLETRNQVLMTFKGIGILLKKIITPENQKERQEAIQSVSGPIGVVNFISSTLSAGFVFLVIIGAIISINLGVFNLLPIPALDGGRFLFIVLNNIGKKIFGKNFIATNLETIIHFTFFIFLIALSLIIAYNDINKIIG